MSDVFVVAHRTLEKQFVAKVLRKELASDPQTLDRVRIEAQALGRLNHVNVVSVTDVGVLRDGRPFIVMEYLRGHSLAEEIAARKTIPLVEALGYACELLSALAAVHATGLVHRDIKPSNLFLCDAPNGRRVLKLLDFGVARVMPGAPANAPPPLAVPTATGSVVGTPRYISPEGAMGERVDHRADLYCAALVLYTLLTGRGPFDDFQDGRFLVARSVYEPDAPSRFMREPPPPELDGVMLRALRRKPDERFQSAGELRGALEGLKELAGKHALGLLAVPLEPPTGPSAPADAFGATEAVKTSEPEATVIGRAEDEIATHTAVPASPQAKPKPKSGVIPPAWKRVAAVCAFLLIAAVTFAIVVGLMRFARAYVENG